MRTKTTVKAGGININHNQNLITDCIKPSGVRVKTSLKAGQLTTNHSHALLRAAK